jgi:hypothetical protein
MSRSSRYAIPNTGSEMVRIESTPTSTADTSSCVQFISTAFH